MKKSISTSTHATSLAKPFFSVVIPALNEEKYLPTLLKHLTVQSFTDFEVIVVDGQSEDKTLDKIKIYEKKLPLRIASSQERNAGVQRNLGAELANGSWLVFMDADNQLPSHFLLGLKYQLEKHPDTDVFTAWMNFNGYKTNEEKIIAQGYNLLLDVHRTVKNPTAFGALLGVKKNLFKELAFDQKKIVFEDRDLVKRACKLGYTFNVFSDPQYLFSFRRLKKEGRLKMIAIIVSMYLMGIVKDDSPHYQKVYPMKGGKYYEVEKDKTLTFFKELDDLIVQMPKNSLVAIKNKITGILENALT